MIEVEVMSDDGGCLTAPLLIYTPVASLRTS